MKMNMVNTKKITGFTLLEVMIALVISAVSLLGLASLQAQSLSLITLPIYDHKQHTLLMIF